MSAIQIQLGATLARFVRYTAQLKEQPRRSKLYARIMQAVDFVARGAFYVFRNHYYLSIPKLANMALANIQFKLKTEYAPARPYSMKIESTNICNTKCQLCPTGIGLEGRAKGKMSFDDYKKLIDRTKWHLLALDLSMWGDPLIVPDIYDMIRYAHDRRIWTYISSNLHAFKPGKGQAEALVRSGLDMLTCSLHGATQATYEKYQPGKNFEEAVEKVRHIIETRNRMGSQSPQVQLNFVVTRHNEHEIAAFRRLADELGCKAVFSTASMNLRFLGQNKQLQSLGLAPDLLRKKKIDHLREWAPNDQEYLLEPYRKLLNGEYDDQDFNGRKIFDCNWPWRASVVNWDGQVVTCCGSFDPGEDMGNIFEQPFGKIWNGKTYRMSRRSFKKRVDASDAENNPCASCPGFML
jgi:radical SAM protein with 4Fe4S-binding SPASM domain